MPAISSTSHVILNLAGTKTMRPSLDALLVQQDAPLRGTFGCAGTSTLQLSGSHQRRGSQVQGGKPTTCDANDEFASVHADLPTYFKKSKKTIKSDKCPAFFSILATVLGRIIDGTSVTPPIIDVDIHLCGATLQRAPESASLSQQPKATHKRTNKNKNKKAKKATPTAILGRIIDALSKYTKASGRLVTHTISSLLSRLILRRASESASLLQQTRDTHQKKNKKETKRKTKKTKKTPGTLFTPSYVCPYPSTASLVDDNACADQTRIFSVLRGSAASNSNHGDVDAEADEYLRSAFNVPNARSPPWVGWSDYEVDETLGRHPPVEELDSWMFPSIPFEPFSHSLSSDDALATLAAADTGPTRPFGFVRTNYVERVDYNEAYETTLLNVALDLPFSMKPFIYP
ncbi:hypothetical protein ONZ51_g11373 [Trametes cubensis]|uniref:Uncharacterized protein n=1 Tax=Trametes cubensis TaxID=1111947 RepID=A0AAD7THS4_9APHY|nr:hypothetical protein ONZ51_g11373 [Trametes cubensis]